MISRLPATPLVASSSAAAAASDRVANHRWPATPRRPRRVAWLRRWPAAAPAAANDSVATSPVVSNSAASSSSGITSLVASSSAAAAANDRVATSPVASSSAVSAASDVTSPVASSSAAAAASDSVSTSPVASNSAASSSSGITSLVAAAAQIADGCARLQCLARCCSCGGGDRAHRALEDTVAIRNVMGHFAAASGLSTKSLLTPFARRFDVDATLLARSYLC